MVFPTNPQADHFGNTLQRADSTRTLAVIFLARFALNFQFRVVYPFLPAISRGLGVPLETASLLLTIRALVGSSSPIYGLLADRYGRRVVMLAGLIALVLGSLLLGVAPGFGVAAIAFAILGLSKSSYDPAMQAYIGDVVPYTRRGRVLGILELPWALCWLIGVPIAGFLIALVGWRSPFWLIAGLGVLALLATWLLWPACGRNDHPLTEMASAVTHRGILNYPRSAGLTDLRARVARFIRPAAALSVTCLLMLASDNVFIVYGAWLETQFGLAVTTLGLVSIVISVAELAAEGSSAGLVDRLGKRRAVISGLLLNLLAYLLLPHLARQLGSALFGMALITLAFEFSIVSLVPLVSELAPATRGTIMSLNVAAMSVARMISSLIGPRLWVSGGLQANAVVSAGIVLLALLLMWRGVEEQGDGDRHRGRNT